MKRSTRRFQLLPAALLVIPAVAYHAGRTQSSHESGVLAADRPAEPTADVGLVYPQITAHGGVVQLPAASDQPRSGANICVDITAGGDPRDINPAIEKVARYVNIYSGAGREPASAEITVVLHGDATLCALSAEAYAGEFQTDGNPNISLLRELEEAGVQFRVCGQSLAAKGHAPEEVCGEVEVAVSALTVLVNRQTDGYAYVPLLK